METEVQELMIIGITGGIGSGKSMVADILKGYGAKIIIADKIAKEIVKPGMPVYEEIIRVFGTDIIDERRMINRKKLGDLVFSNRNLLKKLEGITHGTVTTEIKKELEEFINSGYNLLVVEAVVPVRHGFLDLVDTVWVVAADEFIRLKRIMERNQFTEDEAKQRISVQMPDNMYKKIADQVIYNNGTIENLRAEVWEVLKNEKKKRLS